MPEHDAPRQDAAGGDAVRSDINSGEARLRAALRHTEGTAQATARTAAEAETTGPAAGLDSDVIARRARRRRLPKLVASGAVASIAVLGLGTAAVQSFVPLLQPGIVSDHAASEQATPHSASGIDGGQAANSGATAMAPVVRCGEPIPAASAPAEARGLRIDLVMPDAATIDDGAIHGEVLLTNTGDELVRATSPLLPTAALADEGVIVWHTYGVIAQVVTDLVLAPGDAHRFAVTVEPLRCDDETELESGTAAHVTAGTHRVVALLDITFDDGTGSRFVSEPATILLD